MRNWLYDAGLLKSYTSVNPVFILGNLSTGGTGKTPHTIYLTRLLEDKKPALLSRGYGRKRTGYREVHSTDSVAEVGDEPLLIKCRFPKVPMAVSENRVEGILTLEKKHAPGVFILDDAFQHRAVKGSCCILLTTYQQPFYEDHLLPAGNLRETKSGKGRANIILVTKCPIDLSEEKEEEIKARINAPDTPVFFSSIEYKGLRSIFETNDIFSGEVQRYHCLLLTGIAHPETLVDEMTQKFAYVKHLSFPDHHNFSMADIQRIQILFDNFAEPKIIVTTEKDAVRLRRFSELKKLPIFYQEMDVSLGKEAAAFDTLVKHYAQSELN